MKKQMKYLTKVMLEAGRPSVLPNINKNIRSVLGGGVILDTTFSYISRFLI